MTLETSFRAKSMARSWNWIDVGWHFWVSRPTGGLDEQGKTAAGAETALTTLGLAPGMKTGRMKRCWAVSLLPERRTRATVEMILRP